VRAVLVLLAVVALPCAVAAQEWRATGRVGRVTYDGASTGASGSSSAVLGLSRATPRDWLGASVALPLGEDPFWAVLSGWKRLETRGAQGVLIDLSASGYLQRDRTTETGTHAPGPIPLPSEPAAPIGSDQSGDGVGGELMAGLYAGSAALRLESRAGIGVQRSRLADVLQERALPGGDVRLSLLLAPVTVEAETRAWLDDEVTHTYVGSRFLYRRGPLQLWGSLGQWVAGGIDRVAWSAGAGVAVAPGVELQLGGRGHAFDPLWLSSTETSVWGGLSLHVGGTRGVAAPVPGRSRDGRAVIGIPARSAKGVPSIAGDFTGWKPVPMRREGSRWVYSTRLAPGVYHYAFVAEDGTWFVPESVPGRQDDGMGGIVAVLVVS
jgi:hypothetical protein